MLKQKSSLITFPKVELNLDLVLGPYRVAFMCSFFSGSLLLLRVSTASKTYTIVNEQNGNVCLGYERVQHGSGQSGLNTFE